MTDRPTPQELLPVLLTTSPCPWLWLVPLPPRATRSQAGYFPTVRSGGRGSPTHSSSPVEVHGAGRAGRSHVTTLGWHRPSPPPRPESPDLLQKPRWFWLVDLIPWGCLGPMCQPTPQASWGSADNPGQHKLPDASQWARPSSCSLLSSPSLPCLWQPGKSCHAGAGGRAVRLLLSLCASSDLSPGRTGTSGGLIVMPVCKVSCF